MNVYFLPIALDMILINDRKVGERWAGGKRKMNFSMKKRLSVNCKLLADFGETHLKATESVFPSNVSITKFLFLIASIGYHSLT